MSARTIKRLAELQRILNALFDPASTMPQRRRLALERRACRLYDLLHGDFTAVVVEAKRLSKCAGGVG